MPSPSLFQNLHVRKRDGRLEEVSYDKVTNRIKYLCLGQLRDGTVIGPPLNINYGEIAREVIGLIIDGISTAKLDEESARICAQMVVESADYAQLAGRIAVSNHQKNTLNSFADTIRLLYENKDVHGNPAPLIARDLYKNCTRYAATLESYIDYTRDYLRDYFGFKTLERGYLLKRNDTVIKVMERPQHMYMRVALALWGQDIERVKETYDYLSLGKITHATPTMYNAGTPRPQLSSCFLLGMADSIDEHNGIADCWATCGRISKWAGGIGFSLSNVRAATSLIRGTNGESGGIVPWLKIFNEIANGVNQGGKRKGSFAAYLEPWHADIIDFLQASLEHGDDKRRARDMFYALWIPDLFMQRLEKALKNPEEVVYWSLMCPDECPGLVDTYGEDFEELYTKYETERKYKSQLDIREVWNAVLTCQKEKGNPYMLYKDSINRKNNQSNLGTIRNSNLCAEIVEFSSPDEHAVCNLGSISLNQFAVRQEDGSHKYDFSALFEAARIAHRNLDRVIDINYYPTPETRRSNLRHRPVGLGVQGLADAFMLMRYSFDSPEAAKLNRNIFETIYFGVMTSSAEIAEKRANDLLPVKEMFDSGRLVFSDSDGFQPVLTELTLDERELVKSLHPIKAELSRPTHIGSYSSFIGSPLSEGKFQFDLWNEKPDPTLGWDWDDLRERVVSTGVRNSLTTAVMPTASTAQILGNNECIEPFNYNIYTRRVLAGEYNILNRHLQNDLARLDLWTPEIKHQLVKHRGSIQNIPEIPDDIKSLYRTAYELKQRTLLELARDRAPFIDQTQSLNVFMANPTNSILTSIHFHGWKLGLKTGTYYCRRQAIRDALQFTVDASCVSCSV